jgi:hypothetical protein
MRRFWGLPAGDLLSDPGLKLADAVADGIRLPADFTWEKPQRGR